MKSETLAPGKMRLIVQEHKIRLNARVFQRGLQALVCIFTCSFLLLSN